ncbi:MAG: GNAT family N-acetyltransferase [Candidatus Bathyarchaeota archaeon]|nr:GNAT family N-acetyltransferase [Candidatus Bathyarchaeota archaeon]MDH5495194.1 GNAT family N-acetyltransferase [Candidatus Bathyarchaeota archaeon]
MKRVRLKNGRESVVRRFTAKDKEKVVEMFASMSKKALEWAMPPYTKDRLERGWWSRIQHLIALVAEYRNRIVGYAQIFKHPNPRHRGIGELLIYLHQDFHNVGLGTAMNEYLIELAKKERLHRIGLSVVADNKIAIHMYEKLGFKIEGICKDAYFGDDGKYHDMGYMGLILTHQDAIEA